MSCPQLIVTTLIEVVMVSWGHHVKYGRAWRAKQHALKLIHVDWSKSYKHLLAILHAMKAKNLGRHFEYIPKPEILGPDSRHYFFHAFWTFGQCIEAFKHCWVVLSINGVFLTGKYKGTLFIAIDINADRQLVPLAFAIVRKENNNSWGWFIYLVQKLVFGLGHEICVISDCLWGDTEPRTYAPSVVHTPPPTKFYQTWWH
jgi:hypothetical protein